MSTVTGEPVLRRAVKPWAGGDIVPLSRRVGALTLLRLVLTATTIGVLATAGRLDVETTLMATMVYLAATAALAAFVITVPRRGVAIAGFGILLSLDGTAVLYAQELLGTQLSGQLVTATFLGMACLLGSFRTGLKLAVWQSLLLVIHQQSIASGLVERRSGQPLPDLGPQLVQLWVLVFAICASAAISERELRRRRYDAEALQQLASDLHHDDTPALVLHRTMHFLVQELGARRVAMCARDVHGLKLVGGHNLAETGEHPIASSALLGLDRQIAAPMLILRLDEKRDPWLAALLPDARRLVVLSMLGDPQTDPAWIVFEHDGVGGTRVERRIVVAAGQASSIAAIALSRATLFQRSLTFAATDGLTGLPNRRSFDTRIADLCHAEPGQTFTLILADVDHFKSVNDVHGHVVGDSVLRNVGRALALAAPQEAQVTRYGGEEFAIVLAGTCIQDAAAIAEHLRSAVAQLSEPWPLSASFGVSAGVAGEEPTQVIQRADSALYQAKAAGRNRVCVTA